MIKVINVIKRPKVIISSGGDKENMVIKVIISSGGDKENMVIKVIILSGGDKHMAFAQPRGGLPRGKFYRNCSDGTALSRKNGSLTAPNH